MSSAVESALLRHEIVKDCFVVDLGNVKINPKLVNQLSKYNSRIWKIRRLFVLSGSGLCEILLQK